MIIVSVQHTGTRYLAKHLQHDWAGHCTPINMEACRMRLRGNQGVVPMRHPALVYESWRRRSNMLRHTPSHCTQQFDNLIELDREFDLRYVFVEDTTWGEPISTHGNAQTTITPEMLKAVPDKVMVFYNAIRNTHGEFERPATQEATRDLR